MAGSLVSERATVQDPLFSYAVQGHNLYASPAHQRQGARDCENGRATESGGSGTAA